jgi:hypothetical protein
MSDVTEKDEVAERQRERAEFWEGIVVPINEKWREDNTNFANPVDVADMFARATGTSTGLASQAEALTEEIANFEFERDEADIQLSRLRRQILADNFSGLKASWGSEVVEAFILASARESTTRLTELEKITEDATRQIRLRKPSLSRLEKRLKSLEKHMEWAREWMNYEKLMQRITQVSNRR